MPRLDIDSNDLAAWTLDESALPCVNTGSAGSGANLTTGVGGYTLGVSGKWGNAAQFPGGSNCYLHTANGVVEPAFPVTLSCWVYVTANGQYYSPVVKWGGASSWAPLYASFGIQRHPTNTTHWYAWFKSAAGNFAVESLVDGPLNQWSHIGVTYDGDKAIFYQDGVRVGVTSNIGGKAIDYAEHGRWAVGGAGNEQVLPGKVDDVRIASVARSEAWFKQAYAGRMQYNGLVIKAGIPTIIGVDSLRADRAADAGLTTAGLASGDAVQVSGALTLQKAVNTSTSPIIGIYDGVSGSVVREGVAVATFSGSCPAAGSAVYLSSTAGQLTGTKPTSDKLHEVGVVVDASTSKILLQPKPVIVLPDA